MKKRALFIILVLLLTAFSSVSVFAATSGRSRVDDRAGLLGSGEKSQVEEALNSSSSKLDMDVVVVTEKAVPESYSQFGDSAAARYAADLVSDYSQDTILLLFCDNGEVGNRDYAFATRGEAKKVFDGSALDAVENKVLPYLRSNDYAGAFKAFADQTSTAKNFKFGLWSAIAAGIGALVGAIRSGSLKSQLKSVYNKEEAQYYIKKGSFNLTKKYDIPTYKTVERVKAASTESKTETVVNSSGEEIGVKHGKV